MIAAAATAAATSSTVTTVEKSKLFHYMEREIFCKLIFSLHHNPLLAIRIMTFWLWLETTKSCHNLISGLNSVTITILNTITLETIACIYCIDDETLALSIMGIGIPCLRHIVRVESAFSLPYLVDNRATVLESMKKISNSVYAGAFQDLLTSQLLSQRLQFETHGSIFHSGSSSSLPAITTIVPTVGSVSEPVVVGRKRKNDGKGKEQIKSHEEEEEEETNNSTMRISTQNEYERTVFLLFSKGNPMRETQLRDFFIGRFGDIIEDLVMQKVEAMEQQVLYAWMLVRSSNEVDRVLGGEKKVKFTINGKYVYAHKLSRVGAKVAILSE